MGVIYTYAGAYYPLAPGSVRSVRFRRFWTLVRFGFRLEVDLCRPRATRLASTWGRPGVGQGSLVRFGSVSRHFCFVVASTETAPTRGSDAVMAVFPLLAASDKRVRCAAWKALGSIAEAGDPNAITAIVSWMLDSGSTLEVTSLVSWLTLDRHE